MAVHSRRSRSTVVSIPSPQAIRRSASRVEISKLSPRETQCLLLVAEGQTSKEIARALDITLRTVEFHIHNAMGKLGVTKRGQAALRLLMFSSPNRKL